MLHTRRHLCAVAAVPEGGVVTFDAVVRGELRPCFVVRLPGTEAEFAGFLNVCAHRNQPVVVNDNPFEHGLLECRAHGARYEPGTGVCVEGPCVGARLVPVPIEADAGELFAIDDDTVDDSIYDE